MISPKTNNKKKFKHYNIIKEIDREKLKSLAEPEPEQNTYYNRLKKIVQTPMTSPSPSAKKTIKSPKHSSQYNAQQKYQKAIAALKASKKKEPIQRNYYQSLKAELSNSEVMLNIISRPNSMKHATVSMRRSAKGKSLLITD